MSAKRSERRPASPDHQPLTQALPEAHQLSSVPLPAELVDDIEQSASVETFLRAHFSSEHTAYNPMSPRVLLQKAGMLPRALLCPKDGGCTPTSTMRWVFERVAILHWLPRYSLKLFLTDLRTGVTVGVVLIPQGMAYAMLAELPAIYGLYAALAPLPIYAAFCSSRHMSIGPFALVSLLVADSVADAGYVPEQPEYVPAVMLLSLMIGLLHCAMSALNLGVLVRFISDSVLAGFTSASAVLIASSQLKHLFGMAIPRSHLPEKVHYILTHANEVNPAALATGLLGIAFLVGSKEVQKRWCPSISVPEQLLLLVVATLVSWAAGLEPRPDDPTQLISLPVVGEVPAGLPHPNLPPISFQMVQSLVQPALVVGLFSFILSMSIVRTFALKYDYTTDSNQELLALGLANILGALFSSYPAAGSLSRSALVASTAGANCTPMHGVFTALLVLVTLLLLTPTFRPMPSAVLASIVFMAVRSLFDMSTPRFLYRVKFSDFIAWAAAFVATLVAGVQLGIAVGFFTSMLLLVMRQALPNHAILGRLPGTNIFRDVRRYHEAKHIPGVVAFRFDASLNFANKDIFYAALQAAIDSVGDNCDEGLTAVIIEFGSINDVDASALRMLQDVLKELEERHMRLLLSNCKGPVRDVFEHSGFINDVKPASLCVNITEAVKYGARLHAVRIGKAAPDLLSSEDSIPGSPHRFLDSTGSDHWELLVRQPRSVRDQSPATSLRDGVAACSAAVSTPLGARAGDGVITPERSRQNEEQLRSPRGAPPASQDSDGSEDAERISEHRAQRDQEVVDLAAAAAASGKTLSKRQLSRKPARSASLPKPASLPWAATGDEALGDSGRPSSGALSSGCAAAESAPQPAVRQAAGVPSLLSSVVVSGSKPGTAAMGPPPESEVDSSFISKQARGHLSMTHLYRDEDPSNHGRAAGPSAGGSDHPTSHSHVLAAASSLPNTPNAPNSATQPAPPSSRSARIVRGAMKAVGLGGSPAPSHHQHQPPGREWQQLA